MTSPRASLSKLGKVAAWEYLLRFALGGAITVITGLITKRWGPAIGSTSLDSGATFSGRRSSLLMSVTWSSPSTLQKSP